MDEIIKKSKVPRHVQLVGILKKLMEEKLEPGRKLPSEREICLTYGVSRTTVRQALESLQNQKYIEKLHGKGNFVLHKRLPQELIRFYSFTDEMKKLGKTPTSQIMGFELIHSTEKIAKNLNIPLGDSVYMLTRLRLADDVPMIYEVTYLPFARFKELSKEELEKNALYEILRNKYSAKMIKAEETFVPVLVSELESCYLSMQEGSPALRIERFTHEEDAIIEYTLSIARGDSFQYKVTLYNDGI